MAQPQLVRITGYVVSLQFKQYVNLSVPPTNVTVKVELGGHFCPADVGDTFTATCIQLGPTHLKCALPPFVEVGVDRNSIVQCFFRAIKRLGNYKANKLYEHLAIDGPVQVKLGQLAQLHNQTELKDPTVHFNGLLTEDESKRLLTWWYKNRELRRLYLFGFTNTEIRSCRMSCAEIYQSCITNPFIIPCLSEERCRDILARQGKDPTLEQVQCGAVIRTIYNNLVKRGWTGTPTRYLQRDHPYMTGLSSKLEAEYGMRMEHQTSYLKYPYEVERRIAELLIKLIKEDAESPRPEIVPIHSGRTQLTPDQCAAVHGGLNKRIAIITGMAGSGKTSTISELVHNFELLEEAYVLCSFTGKAVDRIKKAVGRSATTIHRFLSGHVIPNLPRHNPVTTVIDKVTYRDHATPIRVVIDEASMVTMDLFDDLHKRLVKDNYEPSYILVGDPNQLPPISWGALLRECLRSKRVPVYRLTHNHRVYHVSGEVDGITLNANAILNRDPLDLNPFELTSTNNFLLMEGTEAGVKTIIESCHQQGVSKSDITVICPFNRHLDYLNSVCQNIFNGHERGVTDSKGLVWRVGDRVQMRENDYDINVMNGEEGMVTEVNETAIVVRFDSGSFSFNLRRPERDDDVDDQTGEVRGGESRELTTALLALSFAMTVHKSQGSEWDFVVCFVPAQTERAPSSGSFLNCCLIYPLITRGKRADFIVGSLATINKAAVTSPPYRHENLSMRLSQALPMTDIEVLSSLAMSLSLDDGPDFPPDYD